MKRLLPLVILCAAASVAYAQRGGGMRGGGGMSGGGFRGGSPGGGFGGSHGGGSFGGGIRTGGYSGGGFRGGYGYGGGYGYRGGYNYGGYNRGFGYGRPTSSWFGFGLGGYGYPYGYGYWPSYPYYGYSYLSGYPYTSLAGYGGYGDYGYSYAPAYSYSQPAVTVVYGPQAQAPQYVAPVEPERARPMMREYDQYGQEVKADSPASSPLYLFAFRDQSIHAAASYWVEGQTLHYVTLQREEKTAPLDTLDRTMTLQLNRERRVTVKLP